MKKLDNFAETHFASLLSNLQQFHQFQQTDTLHRIRVDIKKLKSVIQVMESALKRFEGHEHYKPFRNIFRKAGQVRQPEVMLKLLMARSMEGLPVGQLGESEKHKEEFRAEVPFYIEQVSQQAIELQSLVSFVRTKDLENYLRRKMKSVKSRLHPTMKHKNLHNIRKSIKQIIYLSSLVKRVGAKKLKFFVRIENCIGKLHDKEVLVDFLETLSEKADASALTVLMKACAKDRKKIGRMAGKFYS